jgi:uncharacterized membrane protein
MEVSLMKFPLITTFGQNHRRRNASQFHIPLMAVERLENRLLLSADAFFRPQFDQLLVFISDDASVVITVEPGTNAVLVNGSHPAIVDAD